jgi:predicted pyridoxine 5'-phosphate oxidase superfamily flavin-nucleotide-binding protein
MTEALQGWHPGEVALQRQLGYTEAASQSWRYVENFMRQQHRAFHTSKLPFIPITAIDERGRPWASILAGAIGEIGFVKSPDANTLTINARLWDGDPLLNTVKAWLDQKMDQSMEQTTFPERFLTAGIGIEYTTRRRNKFAGRIAGVKPITDLDYELNLKINESVG